MLPADRCASGRRNHLLPVGRTAREDEQANVILLTWVRIDRACKRANRFKTLAISPPPVWMRHVRAPWVINRSRLEQKRVIMYCTLQS